MGEEGGFAERRALRGAGDGLDRDAGQIAEQRLGRGQRKRHERGAGLDHLQPEAAGEAVGEVGRAELGDRRPAGGDDQRRRGGDAVAVRDGEAAVGVGDLADRAVQAEFDVAPDRSAWSHSSSSIATICRAEPSQNNWPSVFSCQAMPWLSTNARKSAGV